MLKLWGKPSQIEWSSKYFKMEVATIEMQKLTARITTAFQTQFMFKIKDSWLPLI